MKRATLAATFVALMALFAWADSAHFVRFGASLDGSSLDVSFKEAGLGTNQNINYTASASADATYVCINGGGNHPQAANKEDETGVVTASGTFNSGKNGQVTASLTVDPPETSLTCPGGQHLELACVVYTNITLTDTTNGVTAGPITTPLRFEDNRYGQFCSF